MIALSNRVLPLTACLGAALLALGACSKSDREGPPDQADAGASDSASDADGLTAPDAQLPEGIAFNAAGSLGERLRFTVAPEALAYGFVIEGSDFGLEGTTWTGTLLANADGTYTPSGAPLARLIYLPQTLLIGAEMIQLAGQARPLLFAGAPARQVAYLPGEIAGLFNFIEYSCDKASDPGCGRQAYFTSHGTIELTANGAFTICSGGDLGDLRAAPCTTRIEGDWSDDGEGILALRAPGNLLMGEALLLPSSQGGKLLIVDLKDTTASGPGLVVGVERVSLAGANLAGAFHFVGNDGNYGLVEVDSGKDAYHGTKQEPGLEPLAYQGTFTRDTPWAGWIAATDANRVQSNALVLPDVGAWINTSLAAGTNTWIDIGARVD